MRWLNDQELLDAYERSICLQLEQDFIELLLAEIQLRSLPIYDGQVHQDAGAAQILS
ncbi:sporulation histidine kinase inhibitor Sda [Paenibacillus filicis]|uniref:Sporulation histidine kinase inhibitor Sda n=1 Tax=Paenibacillus filicis TaxID=669464 RepID=A0ABU9DGF3_9BACL